jgi:hypothetical protein
LVDNVQGVGSVDPSLPPSWLSEANGAAIVTFGGLQSSGLYLLDFAAGASDGATLDVHICWNGSYISCMGMNLAGGSMTLAAGHGVFGFMAQQSTVTLFVTGIPSGTTGSGFTLYPAS